MKQIKYLVVLLLLSSCYSQKKATDQTKRALDEYPTVVAKIARDAFPCDSIGTDSTAYKESLKTIDVLLEYYDSLVNAGMEEKVALGELIDRLRSDRPTEVNCDSVNITLVRSCSKVNAENQELKRTITGLRNAISNIKPVKEIQIDQAQVFLARDSLAKTNVELLNWKAKYEAEHDLRQELQKRIRGKVLIPWWVFVLLGIGLIVYFRKSLLTLIK